MMRPHGFRDESCMHDYWRKKWLKTWTVNDDRSLGQRSGGHHDRSFLADLTREMFGKFKFFLELQLQNELPNVKDVMQSNALQSLPETDDQWSIMNISSFFPVVVCNYFSVLSWETRIEMPHHERWFSTSSLSSSLLISQWRLMMTWVSFDDDSMCLILHLLVIFLSTFVITFLSKSRERERERLVHHSL